MNLTIKTIDSDDNNWESYIETIKQFITQSNFEDNLKHNYTMKRLNIDDWVGASTYETQSGKIAHTGWVVTTAGSGGRTGRTQYETLVCLTSN